MAEHEQSQIVSTCMLVGITSVQKKKCSGLSPQLWVTIFQFPSIVSRAALSNIEPTL